MTKSLSTSTVGVEPGPLPLLSFSEGFQCHLPNRLAVGAIQTKNRTRRAARALHINALTFDGNAAIAFAEIAD